MIPIKSSGSCWAKLESLFKKKRRWKVQTVTFDGDGDTAVIKTKSVKYTGGTAKLLPSDVYIDFVQIALQGK